MQRELFLDSIRFPIRMVPFLPFCAILRKKNGGVWLCQDLEVIAIPTADPAVRVRADISAHHAAAGAVPRPIIMAAHRHPVIRAGGTEAVPHRAITVDVCFRYSGALLRSQPFSDCSFEQTNGLSAFTGRPFVFAPYL